MPRPPKARKTLNGRAAVDSAVKGVCDVLRRSNCAGAMQYVPELTWLLFLRILDEREALEARQAQAVGADFQPTLAPPYRWRDWGAPDGAHRQTLMNAASNSFYSFVNTDLIPHLKTLRDRPNAAPRQKVISEIMSGVDRTRVDTERNLCDVLDKLHEISHAAVDDTHVFTLSQVYEGLLLKMGEKGNDGGQFFTPREVIRAMVEAMAPRLGETIYDPCCGTGGFLAQACEYLRHHLGDEVTGDQLETLNRRTFYGREKENLIYPIALANLILHGIDEPHLWHGNTLTHEEVYGGLFQNAPAKFDVILTNPPFGGKENDSAQDRFAYKTKATQLLFLQDVMASLKAGGRCAIVLDEGVLFQTNQDVFVQVKRKLLDSCDLWCIVSLPAGVFTAAGAGVKTNVLYFTKGRPTEKIWYYDVADVKVGKKTPFTRDKLAEFFTLMPTRGDSVRSWTVDIAARRRQARAEADVIRATGAEPKAALTQLEEELARLKAAKAGRDKIIGIQEQISRRQRELRDIEAKAHDRENTAYDIKAVNPTVKAETENRTPAELLAFIAEKNREVAAILARLGTQS